MQLHFKDKLVEVADPEGGSPLYMALGGLRVLLGADPSLPLLYSTEDEPTALYHGRDDKQIPVFDGQHFDQRAFDDEEADNGVHKTLGSAETANKEAKPAESSSFRPTNLQIEPEELQPGIYMRQPAPVEAYRTAVMVQSRFTGVSIPWARPGDWIITHQDGTQEVVSDFEFKSHYRQVSVHAPG